MKVISAVFLFLLIGCDSEHQVGNPLGVGDLGEGGTVIEDQKLSYGFQEVYGQVIEPYCIECHKEFNLYENVKGQSTEIKRLVSIDEMPEWVPLKQADKKFLFDWIDAGSPF